MKKWMCTLLLMAVTLSANAQFEKKKKYISTSLTGLSLSYSDMEQTVFGLDAMGGYFIEDAWMLYGKIGYDHTRYTDDFAIGVGGRYYFTQNGIYLGAGLQYAHATKSVNNVQLCPEVGYAFFINRFLTIEPSVYYNMSLNDFAHGSKVGLKIGLGFYF
ncbi:MAG: outer membrane beta-barrel protein [Paraprevotella sp.]|nr:outer membrane beta-barrel protein [Paraprevotella sp.]